jgi:ASPIC/UnbV protein
VPRVPFCGCSSCRVHDFYRCRGTEQRNIFEAVRQAGSYLLQDDLRVHFGLGEAARVDRVRIRWPNGETQELGGFDTDRYVTLREPR